MELTELREGVLILPGVTFGIRLEAKNQADVIKALKAVGQEGYTKLNAIDEIDGLPVTLAVSDKNCLAMVGVKSFNIRTFAVTQGDFLVPVFTKEGYPAAIERNMHWTVTNNMRLFLAVKAIKDEAAKVWKFQEAFFFAKSASAVPPGFYKVPLPNLYPDGRICLGREACTSPSLIGVLKWGLRQLNEATWNTDLPANSEMTRKLFRFNPTTLQSEPPEGDWWTVCTRVNRVEMEALCS